MIYYVTVMKKGIVISFLLAVTLFVGGTTSENIVVNIAASDSTVGVATSANIARGAAPENIVRSTSSENIKDSGTHFAAKAVAPYVEKGILPGVISVFYNNGVQEVTCAGYADVELKRPINFDNAFMQCSQSKGFCGVTIAILVEEGRLNLDDPVAKYLPEFEKLWVLDSDTNGVRRLVRAKNALTVRHVMNHTGGYPLELPNYQAMGGIARRMPLRSVAAMAATMPLEFEPGTKARYSNCGSATAVHGARTAWSTGTNASSS